VCCGLELDTGSEGSARRGRDKAGRMVLLAVRHSAGGVVGAGSKCPLRNPDELGRTKEFRASGDVVCKAPISTVPGTPQSEDARSEANTCSPPLDPAAYGGEVEGLFDMVPASAAAVPFDHGMAMDDELELDFAFADDQARGYGDDPMDLVEQWVSSGSVGGGGQVEGSAWPPAHGGYPDPNKAIEWRRQTEPFLRHYPCSHTGGGRRTEFQSDRVVLARTRADVKQEAQPQPQQQQQQPQAAPSEQKVQPPSVPCAGMPRHHHPMHTTSNRTKTRQMVRERITRRLQAIGGDSQSNQTQS